MRNWLNSQGSIMQSTERGTMRTGFLLGCLLALFVTLFSAGASAQLSGRGQITGTVTDKTGAVVANADVTAINAASQIKTVAKTTAAGEYHFSALDPGIYSVVVTAQGFEKLTQENIHVNAMESQVYNPALTVAGAKTEEITVTAEPPQLETSNATLGATMEQETYSELPVEMGAFGSPDQRRVTDMVYLMPGVQGNETNGNATTNVGVINGSGSKGAASDVYVDGLPFVRAGGNGDPRFVWTAISVDAIDQFQVQTNGYSAIYEGQGVMNYTVKQGGAQQHGSVYEFVRNTALDTWGFWGKVVNPITGAPVKPIEHSNEYGINLGGPLVPFGGLKDKLFYFTNYNGFRYSSATPTQITFPTPAQQTGDFSAYLNTTLTGSTVPIKIYDPSSQALCTANATDGFCRYQYGYGPGATKGLGGNPTATGAPINVIPSTEFSAIAKNLQQFLPTTGISSALQNNYVAPNATGLVNWSTTSRIDYLINAKDTFAVIGAVGRQASSNPVGQTTAGRNVGPVPYNYGQTYAPKTAVWILEETHTFTSNLINQIKWGYARYNGPTFTPGNLPKYAASTMGISGTPAGQASTVFPILSFAGTDAPTNWGGTTANSTIAENYTILDNVQWNFGKHSLTFGGQIAWLLYNTASATGAGSTPLTLKTANTETGLITGGSYTVSSTTGVGYASFLLGQFDSGSFTDYSFHPEYGARFRAISPYVQDDWKASSKLTVNLGVRYDFYPTMREVNNTASFFNPSLLNSVTGLPGALQFTGTGANTCNCKTPVNNYFKNFGPRIGLAYQVDPKTVIRASYGIMFSHGDGVGGLAYSIGTLGFAASPSFASVNDITTMTGLLNGGNGVLPSYTGATGAAAGPTYGTGYSTATGFTGTPSPMTYDDPYVGGRAPEYVNWSFGLQRQLTNAIALTASYVGSEGHFLQLDNASARGQFANVLDPKYLSLGARLADTGKTPTTVTADCTTYSLTCNGLSVFSTSQPLSGLLKPYPFHSISDSLGYVGNANYHALQTMLNIRSWHGVNTIINYTWARAIDDGGYFRAGYAIPTTTIYNWGGAAGNISNTRMERTVSTSNQPQHFVATVVYKLPIGRTVLATDRIERAVLGGYSLSSVYQAYSGSPLMITASSCNTNPATPSSSFCPPSYNPNFAGPARINGKWGKGVTTGTAGSTAFIDKNAFVATPSYMIGNLSRTAPYNIYGPGNYQLDFSLARTFPLHLTEGSKFEFRAQWYNVTNHTQFGVASTAWGNSSFGQVTNSAVANRKAAQFTARVTF